MEIRGINDFVTVSIDQRGFIYHRFQTIRGKFEEKNNLYRYNRLSNLPKYPWMKTDRFLYGGLAKK